MMVVLNASFCPDMVNGDDQDKWEKKKEINVLKSVGKQTANMKKKWERSWLSFFVTWLGLRC